MKQCIGILVVVMNFTAIAASSSWGSVTSRGWDDTEDASIKATLIRGWVRSEDGAGATIQGNIFSRVATDGTYIKSLDYSHVAAQLNTIWLLALYGDVLESSTVASFKNVELTEGSDLGSGGDKIADPSNFYLAFVAEDWDDYVTGADNPHIWYGWVNVGVNADGALDVFSSGINLDGGAVRIGVVSTPEPTSGFLLLVGGALLALRRKQK